MKEDTPMREHRRKRLFSPDELIAHLDAKGVTFQHMTREEARDFLENHNYFFKLYSYRANYEKAADGPRRGQYIHLDFSYLRELSTLDCHLRYLIVEMCLTLEHALKVMLLRDIEDNPAEDGYRIVDAWNRQPDGTLRLTKIESRMRTSYCHDLIRKNHGYEYPIWVVCELISFGDLCKLLKLYRQMYPGRLTINPNLLFNVRSLRNSAAHSNCLLYNLRPASNSRTKETGDVIYKEIAKIHRISPRTRRDKLANHPVHDFCVLLYLFFRVVRSEPIKKKAYHDLIQLFVYRMRRHPEYFKSNSLICGTYRFMIYVIRHFSRKVY